MNSLLLSAVSFSVITDLCVAAFILLYFLWGLHKGYAKPLAGIISWGIIIAVVYFGGAYIGNLLLDKAGLAPILEQGLNMILESIENAPPVNVIIDYIGLIIAAFIIVVVVKVITFIVNVCIKKARKPYKRTWLDRIFGGILNVIKGAFVACILISVISVFANIFEILEIKNAFDGSVMTKYLVEYNPITMLFKAILAK